MTFIEFNKLFPSEEKAIRYFIRLRFGGAVTCPHCGQVKGVYRLYSRYVICTDCKNSFSVFHGTIFFQTKLDLRKWFYVINIFLNDKKGVSGCNVSREIGVTYKTAWRMLQQIRAAMGNKEMELFKNIVEADEAYFGGKPLSCHAMRKRGRGTSKTPIAGIIERSSHQIQTRVMLPNAEGKTLTGAQLLDFIEKKITKETTVMTDTFPGYNILDKIYTHKTVNHSIGQYSNGRGVHINTIENFWSIGKRSVIGVYHHVSRKYLQRYANEWGYRANNRKNPAVFNQLLKQAVIPSANLAWKVTA